MKKNTLFSTGLTVIIFIFSMTTVLNAQTDGKARLKGTVTSEDGKPLENVKVKLYSHRAGASIEAVTDKKGVWKAMWIRGGKWDIDFDKAGYEPKKMTMFLKENPKIVEMTTTLKAVKGPVIKKEMLADFEKGNKLFEQGDIDGALKTFEGIINKHPDSYAINLNIGNCYFKKQQYQQAIDAYNKLLKHEPKHPDALLGVGNCYSNMNQTEKALEFYKKVDASKIDDPVVLYNIGVFNFNSGKTGEAVAFLKRSTEVQKDFADGWYQLGMVYMGEGKNEEALNAFNAFLKLDDKSEKAATVREIMNALKQ